MRHIWILAAMLLGACGTSGAALGGGGKGGGGGSGGDPGGYDPASCAADLVGFAECGGDPIGSWDAVAGCMQGDFAAPLREKFAEFPACADTPVDVGMDVVGLSRYDAEGTYDTSVLLHMRMTMRLADACLRAVAKGAPVTPSSICSTVDGKPAGGSTLKCSYAIGECTCSVERDLPSGGSGTYEVRGTKLAMPADGANAAPFCIRDDLMFLLAESPDQPASVLLVFHRERT